MMKKIFKTLAIASVALTTGLTGCSNEDNTGITNTGEEKTVLFSFSQQGQAVSRAAGEHVADQSAVTINDAYIYFVNAGNTIVDRVQIVTTGAGADANYDLTAKTVGINPAKTAGGTEITNVNGATVKVYVVANYPGTYPTSGNIEDLIKTATVQSQSDTDGGVKKVTVYGGNGLTVVDEADNKYSSIVEIKPIAARIELGRITGKQDATSNIKSFTVKGIFIDNYYTTFGGTTLVANGTNVNHFDPTNSADFKYTTLDKIVSDYTAAAFFAQGTPARIYASKDNADGDVDVWGYNLVAPEATGTEMAKLIVCVDDVIVTDAQGVDDATTYAGAKFLTVRNFKTGTATLTKLERGYVYRIKDLQFAETDLTTNPNRNTIDVMVEVSVLPWEAVDVQYDFE